MLYHLCLCHCYMLSLVLAFGLKKPSYPLRVLVSECMPLPSFAIPLHFDHDLSSSLGQWMVFLWLIIWIIHRPSHPSSNGFSCGNHTRNFLLSFNCCSTCLHHLCQLPFCDRQWNISSCSCPGLYIRMCSFIYFIFTNYALDTVLSAGSRYSWNIAPVHSLCWGKIPQMNNLWLKSLLPKENASKSYNKYMQNKKILTWY